MGRSSRSDGPSQIHTHIGGIITHSFITCKLHYKQSGKSPPTSVVNYPWKALRRCIIRYLQLQFTSAKAEPSRTRHQWESSGFLTIIRCHDYSSFKYPWSYSRPSSNADFVTLVFMKVHNSVICSFQAQIFMCFNFLRMVSNTIIPRNSVANQNTVHFTVWNGMVPLNINCGGACVVVSDNFWTNWGNCVM